MENHGPLKPSVEFEVMTITENGAIPGCIHVASEVPYTMYVNEMEIATLLCTPTHLKELTYGFLYTSGIISSPGEVTGFTLDTDHWTGYLESAITPDKELLAKRMYTSGCGKGVIYSSFIESVTRKPLTPGTIFTRTDIHSGMHYLLRFSDLYKATGGVHTVALGRCGRLPHSTFDDIGRHNALDKVIGSGVLKEESFSSCLIFCTGRISSEMLHKAKRCGIPVIVSRGAPTHQAVLRAREMGMTLAGFVTSDRFTVFSHPERISDRCED